MPGRGGKLRRRCQPERAATLCTNSNSVFTGTLARCHRALAGSAKPSVSKKPDRPRMRPARPAALQITNRPDAQVRLLGEFVQAHRRARARRGHPAAGHSRTPVSLHCLVASRRGLQKCPSPSHFGASGRTAIYRPNSGPSSRPGPPGDGNCPHLTISQQRLPPPNRMHSASDPHGPRCAHQPI